MHADKRTLHQLAATILSGLMAKGSFYTSDPKVAACAAWDYTEALIKEREKRVEALVQRHEAEQDDSPPATP